MTIDHIGHPNLDISGECFLSEAHISRQADELSNLVLWFFAFDQYLHLEGIAEGFCVSAQDASLLMEIPVDDDTLIADLQFSFCRNLRHMRDQSKGHSADKIGQGRGSASLSPGHVTAFVTDEGIGSPGFRLPGNHLLAPFFDRTGFCANP